jgi:hypothetical protein
MHSKWQIWDFFQSFPRDSWKTWQGKVVLQAFDPLALRLMKDHLFKALPETERPHQIGGSDAQMNWLEDQFMSLGLFGQTESWVINTPDDAPLAAREAFLGDALMLDGRVLAFAFHSDTQLLKKMAKLSNVTHVQIEAPRFWETIKLVDFLSAYFQLPLSVDGKQYVLQAVENEFMPLFDAFRMLKLNYHDARQVTAEQVKELIEVDRLDQFALATDMGKKAWRPFFNRILSVETDFERLRAVFNFLHGHLLKIADPSYTQGKDRLSKYDQEIVTLSRGWRPEEARDLLLQLQNWELSCRKKDPMLVTELRKALLLAHKSAWTPESSL